ncbi:MAG: HAD-IC family P-type ATPase, partial [Dehalococcoidia bacterium]|nr:HAD-IC family P-type ATPase [Dehalococcoidia bacterium]
MTRIKAKAAREEAPWHALSPGEVARDFEVDPETGLSAEEAERRLERWGPNRLPEASGPSWVRRLAEQFTQFLVLVLLAAAGISLAIGEALDAGAILGIVVLNALLGFTQEYRAERALHSLRSMAAPTATVVRNGTPQRLRADAGVPGDVLQLEDGDIVPADGRLVHATALRLDEAVLTGESVPVDKLPDAVPEDADLAERTCMVYQGALVVHGRGTALVVATADRTEMGRI